MRNIWQICLPKAPSRGCLILLKDLGLLRAPSPVEDLWVGAMMQVSQRIRDIQGHLQQLQMATMLS